MEIEIIDLKTKCWLLRNFYTVNRFENSCFMRFNNNILKIQITLQWYMMYFQGSNKLFESVSGKKAVALTI